MKTPLRTVSGRYWSLQHYSVFQVNFFQSFMGAWIAKAFAKYGGFLKKKKKIM
jgi:hypothetical protein